MREAAHLGRHHREAAAGFAGTRRLDRGVERQEIGLPGDLVDHADDVGDLARGFLDPRHRGDRLRHHLAAAIGHRRGFVGELVGLLRVLGVLLHRDRDLLHRGGGLLQARRLLFGPLRQVAGAGEISDAALDTSLLDMANRDRVLQLRDGGVEVFLHFRGLVEEFSVMR